MINLQLGKTPLNIKHCQGYSLYFRYCKYNFINRVGLYPELEILYSNYSKGIIIVHWD